MEKALILVALLAFCGSVFSLTGFFESPIFEITEETLEEQPLPVVLSSFSAAVTVQNYVQIHWSSQSESGLTGYYVLRGSDNDLTEALMVSALIPAENGSEPQDYGYTDTEVSIGFQYYYWLQAVSMDGSESFFGPLSILINQGGEDGEIPPVVLQTGLRSIYPNPFNPTATISYQLISPANVDITVYNTKGQKVKSYTLSHSTAGSYNIVFDGKDSAGMNLGSGVYQVVMHCGKHRSHLKMVLMK